MSISSLERLGTTLALVTVILGVGGFVDRKAEKPNPEPSPTAEEINVPSSVLPGPNELYIASAMLSLIGGISAFDKAGRLRRAIKDSYESSQSVYNDPRYRQARRNRPSAMRGLEHLTDQSDGSTDYGRESDRLDRNRK